MVGDGFTIKPKDGKVVSPMNGKVVTVFPTKHAIGIVADNGTEGFTSKIEQDDLVEQGQVLMEVDLDYEKRTLHLSSLIVFTNLEAGQAVTIKKSGNVNSNDKNIVEITNGNN